MANTYELIVKTVDQSSRSLRNIDSSLQKLGRTAKLAGAALAGIAGGRVAAGIVNQYREFEKYRTVLTTFLGSQQKANAELQRLQVLANSLPQDLQDITQAFTILSRNGIDTSSESLTAFSNIATANAKSFTQLGEAVADALTGEFERLKEFGIKVSRENDQFVARIGDQQVAVAKSSTDLVRQLQSLGEEGGRFGGAAAANADTLNQSFSNLQGAIFETSVSFGEELKPALKEVTDLTSQLLRDNQELAAQLGRGTGEAIRTLAAGVKLLAENFKLIRDVAIALIFIRIASSVATLIGSIARATAAAKSMGGVFSGISKVFARVGVGIGGIIGRITGLSGAIKAVASLTPIGRVVSVGLTAATAAMILLRNRTFEVGQTTTTVAEVAQASFYAISQVAQDVANFIGQAYRSAVEQVVSFFQGSFGIQIGDALRKVGAFALEVANAFIGYFVVAYRSIVAVFTKLPEAFAVIFKAVGATAMDFGKRLVSQFTSIGNALVMAIQAPFSDVTFEDAFNELTTSAFDGFGAAIAENFTPVTEGINEALASAKQALSENYIEDAISSVGSAVESTVLNFREYQQELALKTFKEIEAATVIDDLSGAQTTLNEEVNKGTEEVTKNTDAVTKQLTKYQEAIKAINDYNQNQRLTAQGMRQLENDFNNGKFTLDEFKIGMEGMGAGMDDIQNRSIAMGLSISESFKSAGDSLARGLASGIARGESIMGSFKNFMQSILEEILYQIIQQAFIKPMIASMTQGFSSAFSAFGAGGAGAFGGGGFGTMIGGSLFGPIGGLLGGFLGFANGGIVPGLPTSGDSVPILATPGEVILNKRQQADVLQGAGDEPVTVNFNISAIDTQTGTEFILKNKKQITGVIQQAYNTRGQSGPLG